MKQPSVLILIRHGKNIDDDQLPNLELPLSEEGVRQALWARNVISRTYSHIDAVFSSTSRRTIQTARVICAERFGYEIVNSEQLLEAGYGTSYETDDEAKQRAERALARIFERCDDKIVMLIAHGRLIAMMEEKINKTAIKRKIENCAITIYSGQKTNGGFLYKDSAEPYENLLKRTALGVNIYFARHGESTSNRDGILAGGTDFPLTENGREQANALANALCKLGVDFRKIYSSPLSRALDTAKAIAKRCGIVTTEEFVELAGCGGGSLEGRPYADWYAIPTKDLWKYGVESFDDQILRIRTIVELLVNSHRNGENVIVTSHSSVYQVFYAIVTNIEDEEATYEIPKPRPGNYCILTL